MKFHKNTKTIHFDLKMMIFRKPGDPSAQRYMVSFSCDKPFEKDGIELISLYVRGII